MKLRQRIMAALLVLVMMFGLVACNDQTGNTEEPSGVQN